MGFCIAALLVCGTTTTCHDMVPSLKDVVLVAIGGIIGDANSQTKALRRKRSTGQHQTVGGNDG